jgi:hypothetical protein
MNVCSKDVEFADPEFVDALCENDSGNHSSYRQVQRKTQQFCRQVQRALNLALADSGATDGMLSRTFLLRRTAVGFWCTY